MKRDHQDELMRCDIGVRVKSLDEKRRSVEVVASTDSLDSHGEYIDQASWDLKRYSANPVVLYHHNREGFLDTLEPKYTLPVGYAENVKVTGRQLEATLVFVDEKASPMAEYCWQAFKQGSMRAVSVGFRPKTVTSEKVDDRDITRLANCELYEISACPMGANPEAVAKALERTARQLAELVERAAVPYQAYKPVDQQWDRAAAVARVKDWASSDGSGDPDTIDWQQFRRAFSWYDRKQQEKFSSYKLPHHDVVDGELKTIRAGVIQAGNAANRPGTIPDEDLAAVQTHLGRHFAQFKLVAPWDKSADETEPDEAPPGQETNMTDAELKALRDEHTKQLETEREKAAVAFKLAADLKAEATLTLTKLTETTARLSQEELAHKATADQLRSIGDAATVRDVDDLIGKKFVPAQRDAMLAVARSDRKAFDAIVASSPDLKLTEQIVPADKKGAGVAGSLAQTAGSASEELAQLIDQSDTN